MPEWKVIHKVTPEYPPAAIRHRIQGTVRFQLVIAADGYVERVRLISGHPLLVRSATGAVWQWVFRPTLIAGQPARVITQVEVPFRPADRQPDERRRERYASTDRRRSLESSF